MKKFCLIILALAGLLFSCARETYQPKDYSENNVDCSSAIVLTEQIIEYSLTDSWFPTYSYISEEDIHNFINSIQLYAGSENHPYTEMLQSVDGKCAVSISDAEKIAAELFGYTDTSFISLSNYSSGEYYILNESESAKKPYSGEILSAYTENSKIYVECKIVNTSDSINFGTCRFIYESSGDNLKLVGLSADYNRQSSDPDSPIISYAAVANSSVPDFLDEEQKELYLRAKTIYPLFIGLEEPDNFPLSDGRWFVKRNYESIEGEKIGGKYPLYTAAEGRYEDYGSFIDMIHTVFTDEYAEVLAAEYINVDGRTYYPSASKGGNTSYVPNLYPDTFNLTDKTDELIEFEVTGHYIFEIRGTGFTYTDDEVYTISAPIRMVRTENGWRFDLFNMAADLFDEDIWNEKYSRYMNDRLE
ncbi:MAG: hypothetical protein ACI4XJ_02465 [Eubacteriales bacterium]